MISRDLYITEGPAGTMRYINDVRDKEKVLKKAINLSSVVDLIFIPPPYSPVCGKCELILSYV
jgi:hypothetical protein